MSDEEEIASEEEEEEEDPERLEKWVVYSVVFLIFLSLVPVLSKVKRTRGRNPIYHGLFVAGAVSSVICLPGQIQSKLFSETGVLIVGTLLPVYESIVAAVSIGVKDDIEWIQFWIVNATFTYATEWVDSLRTSYPTIASHWYQIEFFATLWFLLPFTDGSTLLYDYVTAPYIAPVCATLKRSMDGKYQMILAVINSGYIWLIWSTFVTLPEAARRFVVVACGTVYPIVASTVSITTEEDDETFWLTYWSAFSLLFVMMDYLETFVGSIRGFYSICLVATVYLFLPMFRGAEVVFRRVLVPLSGQYENMLLRDAYLVKREMERRLPPEYRPAIMAKAARVFAEDKKID